VITPKEIQDRFQELETEARRIDHLYAAAWGKRSKVKWLALGEAPTKYCFAQLKAKHAREIIQGLKVSDNRTVTSNIEMKNVTKSFTVQTKK
jgi:hypothetical protein